MAFLTGFQVKFFDSPLDLKTFVAASVTTIYAIVFDNSGKYVLFFA